MKEKKIRLESPDIAHEFVKCTSKCDFDVDIMYGHITIDAKSVVGVFSLDLNKPIMVRFGGKNKELEQLLSRLAVS